MLSQEACSTLSAQMGTPQGTLSVKSPSWRDLWPPPSNDPTSSFLPSLFCQQPNSACVGKQDCLKRKPVS